MIVADYKYHHFFPDLRSMKVNVKKPLALRYEESPEYKEVMLSSGLKSYKFSPNHYPSRVEDIFLENVETGFLYKNRQKYFPNKLKKAYKIVAKGSASPLLFQSGLYSDYNSPIHLSEAGYNVHQFSIFTGNHVLSSSFFTEQDPAQVGLLTEHLNSIDTNRVVVICTNGNPKQNMTPELVTALRRFGANVLTLNTTYFKQSGAYILGGIAENTLVAPIEVYYGKFDNDPSAIISTDFFINENSLGVTGIWDTPDEPLNEKYRYNPHNRTVYFMGTLPSEMKMRWLDFSKLSSYRDNWAKLDIFTTKYPKSKAFIQGFELPGKDAATPPNIIKNYGNFQGGFKTQFEIDTLPMYGMVCYGDDMMSIYYRTSKHIPSPRDGFQFKMCNMMGQESDPRCVKIYLK